MAENYIKTAIIYLLTFTRCSIPLDSSISSLSDPERLLKAKQGFFVRSSSNSVFCPQGFSLSLLSSKSDEDTFIGASFCRNCPLKCCSSSRKILSLSKKKIIQGSRYYHTQTPKFKSISTLVKVVRITYIPDKKNINYVNVFLSIHSVL